MIDPREFITKEIYKLNRPVTSSTLVMNIGSKSLYYLQPVHNPRIDLQCHV